MNISNAIPTHKKNRYMLIVLSFLVLEVVSFLFLYGIWFGLLGMEKLTWYSFTFFLTHFMLMLYWISRVHTLTDKLYQSAAGLAGYVCLLLFLLVTSLLTSGSTGFSDAMGLWLATPFMILGILCATIVCLPQQLYRRIIIGLCLSPFVFWFCVTVPRLILK